METSRGPIHDRLVATYQSLEASILNRVLTERGIADIEARRDIISSFLFAQGVTPSEEFGMNFHEYAHGAADWALEHEASEEDPIEVGND